MAGKVGAANDDWKRPILKLERPLLLVVDQESHTWQRDMLETGELPLIAGSLPQFTLSMRRIKEPF
jgi:hypothetical protein